MQGALHAGLKDQVHRPSELMKVFDVNPMGGVDLKGQTVVLLTYRGADNTVPGMFINPNAGNPNAWTSISTKPRRHVSDARNRNGIARVTSSDACNKITCTGRAIRTANSNGGGRNDNRSDRSPFIGLAVQQAWSSPVSGRLLKGGVLHLHFEPQPGPTAPTTTG